MTRKGRPKHPIDFKRHLATLGCEPGISVAKLALEHGINANLLFKWRRRYKVLRLKQKWCSGFFCDDVMHPITLF